MYHNYISYVFLLLFFSINSTERKNQPHCKAFDNLCITIARCREASFCRPDLNLTIENYFPQKVTCLKNIILPYINAKNSKSCKTADILQIKKTRLKEALQEINELRKNKTLPAKLSHISDESSLERFMLQHFINTSLAKLITLLSEKDVLERERTELELHALFLTDPMSEAFYKSVIASKQMIIDHSITRHIKKINGHIQSLKKELLLVK